MPDSVAWADFRRRCLKPDSDRLGTWTARRIARPIALRITHVVAPYGFSAHQATLTASLTALAAVACFDWGTPFAWLIGALLLEGWYVLDHVDGQLARWRGTASLDGTTLDYLMHHSVNALLPLSIAFGIARTSGELGWCLLGAIWSWGMLLLGIRHDTRYKSFIQRLKHVHGTLHVVGGGGGRPVPSAWPKANLRGLIGWCGQKLFEAQALAHVLLIVAAARCLLADYEQALAIATLAVPALLATPLAAFLIARELRRGEAEKQFAAWFRVPDEESLEFRDGHWFVEASNGSLAPDDRRAEVRG